MLLTTNLMRAFNLQHRVGVDLERPSPRWSSTPVDGPAKGISIASHWDGMLDNYYRLMGWDRLTGEIRADSTGAIRFNLVLCRYVR